MTKPKWILVNELLFSQLRLDRFPVTAFIEMESRRNSHGWYQVVNFSLKVRERDSGEGTEITHSFDLGEGMVFKDELLTHLLYLMEHEVKETIQFETDGIRTIPFNPHAKSI